jgi:hypothetical protein
MDSDTTSMKASKAIDLEFNNYSLWEEYLLTELDLYGPAGDEVRLGQEKILPKPRQTLMVSYNREVQLDDGSIVVETTSRPWNDRSDKSDISKRISRWEENVEKWQDKRLLVRQLIITHLSKEVLTRLRTHKDYSATTSPPSNIRLMELKLKKL